MRTTRTPKIAATLLTVALAATLTGCGGPSEAEKKHAAEAKKAAAAKAAKAKADQEAQTQHDDCVSQLQPLMDALEQINSRLGVGLKNADYTSRVGDVSVAYDALDIDKITEIATTCLTTAALLENAYDQYAKAMKTWDDCISDYNCDFSDGSAKSNAVQKNWQKASTDLTNARNALDDMAPTP